MSGQASVATGRSRPRYQQVAAALMRDIERGRFAVGSMLPPELELCERFGVSRHTAREAIRRLADAGLVVRRAGVGTTVRARTAQARYVASVSDLSELMAFNRRTRLEIRDERWAVVGGRLAELLPGATGQRWLRLEALRFAQGGAEPLVHTDIYVSPAYAGIRERIRAPGALVYRLIEQVYGERVVELRQEIGTAAMPRGIAGLLGARAGAPALRVLRYYYGAGERLMSLAVNTYPGDRFRLATRWRLDVRAGQD